MTAEAPQVKNRLPGNDARRAPTILVIEDQPQVRRVIERMLERFGVRVVSTATGDEGAAFYADHRDEVEMVLCDFAMPGMNGEETALAIHEVDPLATVVLMSGCAPMDLMDRNPRLAAFLQKPVRMETLKRMADVVVSAD